MVSILCRKRRGCPAKRSRRRAEASKKEEAKIKAAREGARCTSAERNKPNRRPPPPLPWSMHANQPTNQKKKQYRVVRRTGQRKHGADTRVGRMRVAVQWRPASQGTPKPSMAPFPLRLLRTATLPRRREARRADCSAPCLPAGLGRGSNGNGGRAISPPACRVPVSWIPGLWIQWQWQWRAGLSEDPAGGHISNM